MEYLFTDKSYRDLLKIMLEYSLPVNPQILFINRVSYSMGRELLETQDIPVRIETCSNIPDFYHVRIQNFESKETQNLKNIKILTIRTAPAKYISINSTSLLELNIQLSNIKRILGNLPNLKRLIVKYSDLIYLPKSLTELDYLNIKASPILNFGNIKKVKELNIKYTNKNLVLTKLQKINILHTNNYHNSMEKIEVDHLILDTYLDNFDFSKCPIKKITIRSPRDSFKV